MIKLKSIVVIVVSSLLISTVILLTIIAYSLYVGWEEKEAVRRHQDLIARLNAELYGRFITIQDLRAVYEDRGIYKDRCLLEGMIKNIGLRTVSSIVVNVDFLNQAGDVIYTEKISPLKSSVMPHTKTIAALSLFTSGKEQPLLTGESIQFKETLSEQKDKDIVSPIKYKRYATNPNEWAGKFREKITHIRF